MKMIFLYAILLLVSCNSAKETGETDTPVVKDLNATTVTTLSTGCYQMNIEKDTALMNISVDGNAVTGTLLYKRFEKDSNTGNISGKYENGKITGWYNFLSEGKSSVRQVIFKVSETGITEGYGDIEMTGDTVNFKFPHALQYEDQHPFKKMDCK
ncbi:MAG: hypothetical protein WKF35_05740 [Ferruginibacter sp.]